MKLDVENIAFEKLLIPTAIVTAILFLLTVLTVLSSKKHRTDRYERNWLARLLYLLFIGCISVLAATSFGSILRHGYMEHYALMAHTTAAGGFVFLTLLIAIFFSAQDGDKRELAFGKMERMGIDRRSNGDDCDDVSQYASASGYKRPITSGPNPSLCRFAHRHRCYLPHIFAHRRSIRLSLSCSD